MNFKRSIRFDFRFLVILLVVLFKYIKLEQTISDKYTYVILFTLIGIVFLYLLRNKIKKVKINFFICILFMSMYVFVIYKDINILFSLIVAMLFLTDNKPVYAIIKYYLISLMIIFLMTNIGGYLGILETAKLSRVVDNVYIQRKGLGFTHPNIAFLYYFYIILGYYYINKNIKLFFSVTIISLIVMYKITLCRTGLVCMLIFLLSILCLRKSKYIKINRYIFSILLFLTIILAYSFGDYNNPLNILSSNRLYLWNHYISNGSIFNIFGNKLDSYYIIDNMYLHIILSYGVIILFCYSVIYYISGKKIEKNIKLSIIFNVVLIYGIFESHTFNSGINFILTIQILYIISKNNALNEVK